MKQSALQLVLGATLFAILLSLVGCSQDPDAEAKKTIRNPGDPGYDKHHLRKVKAPGAGGGSPAAAPNAPSATPNAAPASGGGSPDAKAAPKETSTTPK